MSQYSQRDSRWSEEKIGDTQSSIGRYGCLITAFGNVIDKTPSEVNAQLKEVHGYANDLVIWSKVPEAFPELKFIKRSNVYNNDDVKTAIDRNKFCLVEVDYDGKIDSPLDFHWVEFIGNQKLIDPWDGKEKPTNTYPLVRGYVIYDRTIPVSPQPPTPNPIIITLSTVIPQVKDEFGNSMEVQAIISKLNEYKSTISNLSTQLVTANNQVKIANDAQRIAEDNYSGVIGQLTPLRNRAEVAEGTIKSITGVVNGKGWPWTKINNVKVILAK